MKTFIKSLIGLLLFFGALSQGKAYPDPPGEGDKKEYHAMRVSEKPNLDGKLDDDVWSQHANFFKGHFTQTSPDNGAKSSQETEIHIIYNDQSIFIGAKLLDTRPDSVLKQFGPRDSRGLNTDAFAVSFDTYNKKQNAFMFMVSAAGVQTDVYITGNSEDQNWNAVWKSKVSIGEEGWEVEMEIPYSAIRFPKQPEQTWGINFTRIIRRTRETTYWNPVDASVDGFVNQFGTLTGLKNIQPPPRLSFTPYISAYATVDGVNNASASSFNGGMDIKYGISEGFTLDMSLIPDFGQVRSDNVVLNLSPFEVRFSENRPFFTEGVELFNKGGLFYSRRVGTSFGSLELGENEELVEGVNEAPLLNATKLSGRTKNGLGIGVFNAVTNRTLARIRNTETGEERDVKVDPVTNFNVLVFDQDLKNNSSIGFINTNVTRFGPGTYDANVSGMDFQFSDKQNKYRISGFGALNVLYDRDDKRGVDIGYSYSLELGKISGKWQYELGHNVESHDYEINDLGFLGSPNEFSTYGNISYNIFKPKGKVLRWSSRMGFWYDRLYKPNTFNSFGFWNNTWARFKNFWSAGYFVGVRPIEGHDFFEPRTDGYFFNRPSSYNMEAWVDSDSRKRLFVGGFIGYWHRPTWGQVDFFMGISPRFRVNDKLSFNHNLRFNRRGQDIGYATKLYDDQDNLQEIVMGQRNVQNITNTFTLSFAFNALMNINLRVRHYWSRVRYNRFHFLQEDGTIEESTYNGWDEENDESLHDANFNAFNVDLVYTWQFAPGSEMSVVWKDAIVDFDRRTDFNFGGNFLKTMRAPQLNSFSIRVLYFFDYLYLKNMGGRKKRIQ